MSKKNHKVINGKLLQSNKKFSALTATQQGKIQNWLLTEYLAIVEKENRLLKLSEKEMIVDNAYEKMQSAEIWIPHAEVISYFRSKLNKWNRKYIVKEEVADGQSNT